MVLKRIAFGAPIFWALVSLAAGCSPSPDGTNHSTNTKNVAVETDDGVCGPVKVAVVQDYSGSINWTGTPTLRCEDLDPLIDLLSSCGGELGFGLISDNSNRGLVRLTIDFPPAQPMEPSKEGNPYKAAKRHEEYQRDMDEFSRRLAIWQEASEQRIDKFKAQVNAILKREKLAKKTDVWDSIRRADLFLSEDGSAWGQNPLVYAVLITDGQDNVKKERVVTMKSSAKIILVNSFASAGALKGLNPLRFESIESALRFIIADTERRN